MLEPYEGKLSRTVLRGGGDSDVSSLPDFENPIEAVSELGQMRKSAGNHLKLYRVVPVEKPIVTRLELEQYIAENEIEDFVSPLVEEYVTG